MKCLGNSFLLKQTIVSSVGNMSYQLLKIAEDLTASGKCIPATNSHSDLVLVLLSLEET